MMLRQLNGAALFGFLPIGVLGLLMLPAVSWRTALVLWAWLVPGVLLYTSYYWAPVDHGSVHYLRFFLSVFPPIAVGAAWVLTQLATQVDLKRRWVGSLAVLLVALGATAYAVWSALSILESEHRRSLAVAQAADRVMKDAKVPAGSVVIGPEEFLNHFQFVADYRLYPSGKEPVAGGRGRIFAIEPQAKESGPARREILRWTEGRDDGAERGGRWWRRGERNALPPANWRLVEITPGAPAD
jgi:hypothetical protein